MLSGPRGGRRVPAERGGAVVYDVCTMKRTNIYLEDAQLDLLGRVAEEQGTSVAFLVRSAVEQWLLRQKAKPIPDDEWRRRFDRLMARRRAIAKARGFKQEDVDRDVMKAVREVRRARRARGR